MLRVYDVAPLVGAWIEILTLPIYKSDFIVAPLVGAWIEIIISAAIMWEINVAPLVGAWIEILKYQQKRHKNLSLLL